MSKHPLRELAEQLEKACRESPACNQAYDIVRTCAEHLCAIARNHECQANELQLESQIYALSVALINSRAKLSKRKLKN